MRNVHHYRFIFNKIVEYIHSGIFIVIENIKSTGIGFQGLSTKEKYSKVTLWWKGYYLNK